MGKEHFAHPFNIIALPILQLSIYRGWFRNFCMNIDVKFQFMPKKKKKKRTINDMVSKIGVGMFIGLPLYSVI